MPCTALRLARLLALRRRRSGWVTGWREPGDDASLAELLRDGPPRSTRLPAPQSPAGHPHREPSRGPSTRWAGP